MKGNVLGIGDSVTINYTNAPYYVIDAKTGEIVTDLEELKMVEAEIERQRKILGQKGDG